MRKCSMKNQEQERVKSEERRRESSGSTVKAISLKPEVEPVLIQGSLLIGITSFSLP